MKLAVCSDEPYPVHDVVLRWLNDTGHTVRPFGSLEDGREHPWASIGEAAALAVKEGHCDQGIFFCWSGTGISIVANKVPGIRAALCSDPGQVRAARIWNHANVLCLSNRSLSGDMAQELLVEWFDTPEGHEGREGVEELARVEGRHCVGAG